MPPSALRVSVDEIELLNLGGVRLVASSALVGLGFRLGGSQVAGRNVGDYCGCAAGHRRAKQVAPMDRCRVPLLHGETFIDPLRAWKRQEAHPFALRAGARGRYVFTARSSERTFAGGQPSQGVHACDGVELNPDAGRSNASGTAAFEELVHVALGADRRGLDAIPAEALELLEIDGAAAETAALVEAVGPFGRRADDLPRT
jgi:hypothetical protein